MCIKWMEILFQTKEILDVNVLRNFRSEEYVLTAKFR